VPTAGVTLPQGVNLMIEQTGQHRQDSPAEALERRVRALEERLTALTDAVRVLAHGLEDAPVAGRAGRPAAEAARQAYDLLLIAGPPPPGPQAAVTPPDA